MRRAAPFLVIALILALPALNAVGALTPLNDLLALGQVIGQEPAKVAIATRAEPPFVASPRAQCGPGSKPEPGIQGRVPAGSATNSLHCNVSLIDLDEGVRLMSRVEGVPSGDVRIGQRVQARVVQQNGQGLVVFDLLAAEGAGA